MSTSSKGREGENLAAAYLERLGYRILARNQRLPGGEIDIVALDGRVLVFVEVKRRLGGSFGPAIAAVDRRKRARLRVTAEEYAQVVAPSVTFRFDIVTIDGNRLALHRNAF